MKKNYYSLLLFSATVFFLLLLVVQLIWLRQVLKSESDNLNNALLSGLNEASVCMNWYEEEVLNYDSVMLSILTNHISRLSYKDKIYFTKRIKKNINDSFLVALVPDYQKIINLSYFKDSLAVDTYSTFLVFNELKNLRYKVISKYINRSVNRALGKRNIRIDYYLNLEKSGDTLYSTQSTTLDTTSFWRLLLFPHHNYTYRHFLFDTEEDPSEWLLNITYFNVLGYLLSKSSGSFLVALLFILLLTINYILLIKYILKLRNRNRHEQKFIEGVTHDIKTPLSTIKLATHKLSSLSNNKDQIEYYTDIIHQEQGRIASHINVLLNHIKFSELDYHLNKTLVKPGLLINQAITMLDSLIKHKNAKVAFMPIHDFNEVLMDSELMLLSVKNLLENALDHNQDGVYINIELNFSSNHLNICIKDNGVGISEEEVPKIFNNHYSSSNKNVGESKVNHGIGLSFVKWVIDLHQGEITVDSKSGKGTKITLSIPN